ncbi:hypothetical protein GQ457_16G024600 [Hibiscus cannabinus]
MNRATLDEVPLDKRSLGHSIVHIAHLSMSRVCRPRVITGVIVCRKEYLVLYFATDGDGDSNNNGHHQVLRRKIKPKACPSFPLHSNQAFLPPGHFVFSIGGFWGLSFSSSTQSRGLKVLDSLDF